MAKRMQEQKGEEVCQNRDELVFSCSDKFVSESPGIFIAQGKTERTMLGTSESDAATSSQQCSLGRSTDENTMNLTLNATHRAAVHLGRDDELNLRYVKKSLENYGIP